MREPSPSSSRLASESRSVPHVLQRKQSRCHRLPATRKVSQPTVNAVRSQQGNNAAHGSSADNKSWVCCARLQMRADVPGKIIPTNIPSSNAFPSSSICHIMSIRSSLSGGTTRTSPQPLQGKTSSPSVDCPSRYSSTIVAMLGSFRTRRRLAG